MTTLHLTTHKVDIETIKEEGRVVVDVTKKRKKDLMILLTWRQINKLVLDKDITYIVTHFEKLISTLLNKDIPIEIIDKDYLKEASNKKSISHNEVMRSILAFHVIKKEERSKAMKAWILKHGKRSRPDMKEKVSIAHNAIVDKKNNHIQYIIPDLVTVIKSLIDKGENQSNRNIAIELSKTKVAMESRKLWLEVWDPAAKEVNYKSVERMINKIVKNKEEMYIWDDYDFIRKWYKTKAWKRSS